MLLKQSLFRKYILTAFCIIFLVSCSTTSTEIISNDDILLEAAMELASNTRDKTIGISDIYYLGTELTSEFSLYLSNNLAGKLINQGFSVADRKHLEQLRTEWDFQSSYSDEDSTVQIAKMNGILALITGSYHINDDFVMTQLKLIDTQTGMILGTTEFSLPYYSVARLLTQSLITSQEEVEGNSEKIIIQKNVTNPVMKGTEEKLNLPITVNDKPAGFQTSITVSDNFTFNMVYVPAITGIPSFSPYEKKYRINTHRVIEPVAYWIGEKEVTVELWNLVVIWGEENGYVFTDHAKRNLRVNRNQDKPAFNITWRDAIIFCNALTEYINNFNGNENLLTSVYYQDPSFLMPIKRVDGIKNISYYPERSPSGTQDDPFVNNNANGFRLPKIDEWITAACYKGDFNQDGDILDSGEFYPEEAVSGGSSTENYPHGDKDQYMTIGYDKPVASYKPNALGIYDLSGNIAEWCFDWVGDMNNPEIVGRNKYLMGNRIMFRGYDTGLSLSTKMILAPYEYHEASGLRLARNYISE